MFEYFVIIFDHIITHYRVQIKNHNAKSYTEKLQDTEQADICRFYLSYFTYLLILLIILIIKYGKIIRNI